MIVAYIDEDHQALRQGVVDAADGAKVVFRNPATFQPADADALDTVVYVAEADHAIAAVYGAYPGTVVLSLDAEPVPALPAPKVPRRRSRAERQAEPTLLEPSQEPGT